MKMVTKTRETNLPCGDIKFLIMREFNYWEIYGFTLGSGTWEDQVLNVFMKSSLTNKSVKTLVRGLDTPSILNIRFMRNCLVIEIINCGALYKKSNQAV